VEALLGRHLEAVAHAADRPAASVAYQQARLISAARQLEVTQDRQATLEDARVDVGWQGEVDPLLHDLAPASRQGRDEREAFERADLAAALGLESHGAQVEVSRQHHGGLARGAAAEHVGGHPHRDPIAVERRVEAGAHLRVDRIGGPRLALVLAPRVVALSRPDLEPRPRDAHLDLAELAVALRIARDVAEQVVAAGLPHDLQHGARQLVRALDHPAAGVERHGFGALGVEGEVGGRSGAIAFLEDAPVLRLVVRRIGAGAAARVEEIQHGVRVSRRLHELPQLGPRRVVEEPLRQHQHGLAPALRAERRHGALHGLERGDRAPGGVVVDLGGLGADQGQSVREVQLSARAAIGPGRRELGDQAVLEVAPGHHPEHVGIPAVVDLHGLPVADAAGRQVHRLLALHAPCPGQQLGTSFRQPCRPPGPARGGQHAHHVAGSEAVEQLLELAFREACAQGGEVHVVVDHQEGLLGPDPLGRVARDEALPLGLTRLRLLEADRLEADDTLDDTVLLDREVLPGQPTGRVAAPVEHQRVDGDHLDLLSEDRGAWLLRGLAEDRYRRRHRQGSAQPDEKAWGPTLQHVPHCRGGLVPYGWPAPIRPHSAHSKRRLGSWPVRAAWRRKRLNPAVWVHFFGSWISENRPSGFARNTKVMFFNELASF
jgi:hypothetical protein